jgi:ribonucleoside-diphosphate reductase alpha chain
LAHVEPADLRTDTVGGGEAQTALGEERQASDAHALASLGFMRSNLYVLSGRGNGQQTTTDDAVLGDTALVAAVAAPPPGLMDGQTVAYAASSGGAVVLSAATAHAVPDRLERVREARLKGFEGDACTECGNFTLVRNGTCLKCTTCGSTSGCS